MIKRRFHTANYGFTQQTTVSHDKTAVSRGRTMVSRNKNGFTRQTTVSHGKRRFHVTKKRGELRSESPQENELISPTMNKVTNKSKTTPGRHEKEMNKK